MWFSLIFYDSSRATNMACEKWLLPFVNMLGRMARTSRKSLMARELSSFWVAGCKQEMPQWLKEKQDRRDVASAAILQKHVWTGRHLWWPRELPIFCSESWYFSAPHHSWSNQPSFLGVDPDFDPILILQGFLIQSQSDYQIYPLEIKHGLLENSHGVRCFPQQETSISVGSEWLATCGWMEPLCRGAWNFCMVGRKVVCWTFWDEILWFFLAEALKPSCCCFGASCCLMKILECVDFLRLTTYYFFLMVSPMYIEVCVLLNSDTSKFWG